MKKIELVSPMIWRQLRMIEEDRIGQSYGLAPVGVGCKNTYFGSTMV